MKGVSAVMRRPKRESATVFQAPPSKRTSITPMPWAFLDFCTFSAVQVTIPSGVRMLSSVYSKFTAISPCVDEPEPAGIGK